MKHLFMLIFLLLLQPYDSYAQDTLQRLTVTQTTSEARGTVFRNHPDKAGIIIESPLTNLRFSSNLDGIVAEQHQPEQGRYVLIIEPFTQIIAIDAPGFMQERLRIGSPAPRDIWHYVVEPEERDSNLISVIFNVEPEDATLFVDGQETVMNRTVQLMPGDHDLRIERDGFSIIRDTVNITSDNIFFSYSMERVSPQEVVIYTNPPGAAVRINDQHLGFTDSEGIMALFYHPGDYLVDITANGYASERSSIDIREDSQNEFTFTLTRNTGILNLDIQPADATVLINRREYIAEGPIDITPGLYRLEISHEGYEPYVEDIRIEREQALDKTVELNPVFGQLLFSVSPSEAQVTLRSDDGQVTEQWQGLWQLDELRVGTYQLTVQADGFETNIETVHIRENEPLDHRVVLEEGFADQNDQQAAATPFENETTGNGITTGERSSFQGFSIGGGLGYVLDENFNFLTFSIGYKPANKIYRIHTVFSYANTDIGGHFTVYELGNKSDLFLYSHNNFGLYIQANFFFTNFKRISDSNSTDFFGRNVYTEDKISIGAGIGMEISIKLISFYLEPSYNVIGRYITANSGLRIKFNRSSN